MQSVPKTKVNESENKLSSNEEFALYLSENRRMSQTQSPRRASVVTETSRNGSRRASVISNEDKNIPTFHIYKYNKDTTYETGEGFCGKCNKVMYATEKVWGPGNNIPWHKDCLRCQTCNKHLETSTMIEFEEEPYCSSCYTKEHAPSGIRRASITPNF